MAVTTTTASSALQNPRMTHTGLNVVTGLHVTGTGTTIHTLSDIILMLPIPNDAQIVQLYAEIGTGETIATAAIGTQESPNQFGSFTGKSGVIQWASVGLPYNVSLTDGKTPLKTHITVKAAAGTWSTSATIRVTCFYTHEGNT